MITINDKKLEDYTHVIQDALNKGGTVYIEKGHYRTGPLEMKSYTTLHLEAGAVLDFRSDKSTHERVFSQWEGLEQEVYAPLIYGKDLVDVAIVGRGHLIGNGGYWWPLKDYLDFPRPRFICFEDSENILIEGITIKDSPAWTINPIRCKNVVVDKVTIFNPKDSPNTDGINPDSCKNVRISNCHVDVGDDCITIKSGVEASKHRVPCVNIAVTNCTLVHGHGGVVIGSEMSGGVKNVVISNCIFDGTDRGIRIKTRRGRGGIVEDIRVTNIIMNDVLCPIVMNMYYHCGEDGKKPIVSEKKACELSDGTPVIRNIHLSHISAKEVSVAAGFIDGLAESPIKNVTIKDYYVVMKDHAEKGQAAMLCGQDQMCKQGMVIRRTDNIRIEDYKIIGHEGDSIIE
ncbi:glycoside hydrolase family 28 protein [Acidaminobacter sp. JC074]|uniref:glycoside hydrolase family 28 protein n=1 Tax=Acidaminobacter sp. JC074 TaxID=2530199 RepID=UPI001F0F0A1E|nr:glycoside hydrolase family 28 protein [Acidaminobacter sp. JC074]